MNQEFRLKKVGEIRNYLIEEISQNELMSKKLRNVCRVLNYIEQSLIAISTIAGSVSSFAFCFFTQPARDVPWTSTEGPLKVLPSGTSRGPSGDS